MEIIEKRYIVRLQQLVKASDQMKEAMLKHRYKMLEAWASGYFNKGRSRTHMINFMDRGISTVSAFLVSGNPKINVTTKIPRFRSFAKVLELATNYWIEHKQQLAKTFLKPIVIEGLVCPTASRVFNKYSRVIDYDNETIKIAEPHIAIIDLEGYIFDPSAKQRQYFAFEGDRYKLPTNYAKEFFDKYADDISSDSKLLCNFSTKQISSPDMDPAKLSDVDYTTFIDLYLRNERKIITIMPEGKKPVILQEIDWEGDESGPYDVLDFRSFPGSAFGVPPAWAWHDMDVSVNLLAEKMRQQAEAQKDVVAYQGDAEEDARKIANAPNMGMVRVNDITTFKPISFGGVNPDNYKWFALLEQEFTKQGANPDVLGGRGSDSPTLGQEQLVYQNATRVINNMYTTFQDFMVSVIRKLVREFYENPLEYIPVELEIPGVGSIQKVYSSADKVGDFQDFVFDIEPFSTQRKGPELQARDLMQLATQWIVPTLEQARAQGAELDFPTMTTVMADKLGIDDFGQYYKTSTPKETDMVDTMLTNKKTESQGQGNDSLGSQEWSRTVNSQRQAGVEQTKATDMTINPMEGASNV